jgi:hypothetical protein
MRLSCVFSIRLGVRVRESATALSNAAVIHIPLALHLHLITLAQLLHAALVLDVLDELRRVADDEAHSDPENAKNRRNDAQGDRDEDEDEDEPHGHESVVRVVEDEGEKTESERKLEHDVIP